MLDFWDQARILYRQECYEWHHVGPVHQPHSGPNFINQQFGFVSDWIEPSYQWHIVRVLGGGVARYIPYRLTPSMPLTGRIVSYRSLVSVEPILKWVESYLIGQIEQFQISGDSSYIWWTPGININIIKQHPCLFSPQEMTLNFTGKYPRKYPSLNDCFQF